MASILPAEPPEKFKSIRVRIDNSSTGRTFLTDEHILFMPGPVQPGKDGVVEGHRLQLFPIEYLKAALGYDGHVTYPPLRAGDIVPLFGRLYTAGTPTQDAMVFTHLPPADAPKGVAVAERSFVAPATRPGVADNYSLLWDNRLYPRTFGPKPGAGKVATATLEVWPPDKALAEDDVRVLGVTLEAGDILVLATSPKAREGTTVVGKEVGMKVLAVVPPDLKTRVIGWVEFAPVALFAEKEWAKDGGRVVRPTKPGG